MKSPFRIATTRELSVRDVAPGAIAAAIVWQLLQSVGIVYVGHVVKGASATNGVFAVVLRLLAFLYITATVVVLCAEINAVRVDRLHPRALLSPFTDNVDLTPGDRRAYATQAEAQRSKGFGLQTPRTRTPTTGRNTCALTEASGSPRSRLPCAPSSGRRSDSQQTLRPASVD